MQLTAVAKKYPGYFLPRLPDSRDIVRHCHVTVTRFKMAAVGRIFRLSTFTVAAAGGALRLSKDISDNARRSPQNPNLELVMVQIAFRHGARTPIFTAPCKELESVTWPADLLMGALPHTDIDYELKHVSGGIKPFSKYDDRQKRMVLKVVCCLLHCCSYIFINVQA